MRKGRELIGLPILDSISGQRLGEVQDLVLESTYHAISGLLTDKGNWFRAPRQVAVESVIQVDGDEIKVQDLHPFGLEQAKQLASGLNGKKVVTTEGKLLGSIQDVVLDESGFLLTGYEISDGFISDLVSGRKIIDKCNIVTQSKHVLVVKDKLAMIWDSQL